MVGLFLQSGYALLPSQPHHRVSSRLTRNLTLFVAWQPPPSDPVKRLFLRVMVCGLMARFELLSVSWAPG